MTKKYKNNYISNFLVRLDLDSKLDKDNYDKLIELLQNDFPINEKIDIKNINNEDITKNILYNTQQTNRITINSDYIIYESLKYTSFTTVIPILEKIITSLNKKYGVKNFRRIGLRYVNLIKLPAKEREDIFNWKGYISSDILASNNFIGIENILQQINTIEFKLDKENDILCRLQTGIPNRNMPADLMERIFLIDIDGFTNSLIEHEDVLNILDIIHSKNVEIFEKCIDDKLRSDMNE